MSLLVDLQHLCDCHTDQALEFLYKAVSDDPPEDAIWQQHENVFIRRIVELFTQRGLTRIDAVREQLARWMAGAWHDESLGRQSRPEGAMTRWSQRELDLVHLYLRSIPPDQLTLDDRMLAVDYLVQRYLPESDLRSEAEWFAVRASIMGRVQARMQSITPEQADSVVAALPSTVAEAARLPGTTAIQSAMMGYARERCAEYVTRITDGLRHQLRATIIQHAEQEALRAPGQPGQTLESKLFDTFSTMNRDWRRIAVTEAGENANQGMVLATEPGQKLERVELYSTACPHCRRVHGKVMTVVAPDAPDKDETTQIWTGKTNVGRAAAPRKRVAGALVPREPHEMWTIAAGVQHPHCRGFWRPIDPAEDEVDPEFMAWVMARAGVKNEE